MCKGAKLLKRINKDKIVFLYPGFFIKCFYRKHKNAFRPFIFDDSCNFKRTVLYLIQYNKE